MDDAGVLVAAELTEGTPADAQVVPDLLARFDRSFERFIADGAYDTRALVHSCTYACRGQDYDRSNWSPGARRTVCCCGWMGACGITSTRPAPQVPTFQNIQSRGFSTAFSGSAWAGWSAMSSKTALVLAGGGSLGAIQVGMVKALVANGLQFDLLIGASVGALNAAFLANQGLHSIDRLERVWRTVRRSDVFPISLVHVFLALLSRRESLLSPDALRLLLQREVGSRTFEDLKVPLFIVATSMDDGAEIVLSTGPLLPALLASAAIPAVFPAVEWQGQLLIDGGVANNTPISTAIRLGATRVIVAPTGSPCSCEELPRSAVFSAIHALNLASVRQLDADVDRFGSQVELSVVPPLCPLSAAAYAFEATDDLIQRAEQRTDQWIKSGGLDPRVQPARVSSHGPDCPCTGHQNLGVGA